MDIEILGDQLEAQQEPKVTYEINCIFGKKKEDTDKEPMYAVMWEGYTKAEMTWEPFSSFLGQSELIVRRFERCQAYRYYWANLKEQTVGHTIRVHVVGGVYQGQIAIKQRKQVNRMELARPVSPIASDRLPKREFFDEDDSEMQQLRRNRGRPRKFDKDRDYRPEREILRPPLESSKYSELKNNYPPYSNNQAQIKLNVKTERDYLNDIISAQKVREQNNKRSHNQDQEYRLKQEGHYQPMNQIGSSNTFISQLLTKTQEQLLKTETPNHILQQITTQNVGLQQIVQQTVSTQYETQKELQSYTFYNMDLSEKQLTQKICFEQIVSHHIIKELQYRLLFKCQCEDEELLYGDYNTLQQYSPILLLDYMTMNSILI